MIVDALISVLVLIAWLVLPALVAVLLLEAHEYSRHHRDVIAKSKEARRVHTR